MSAITATQFFFNLGKNDRQTLEASKPIHDAYCKASPAQQRQLRTDCMAHYIMGNLECDRKEADRILSQTRTERSIKAQKAYRVANERFTYHVSRTNKKVEPQDKTSNRIILPKGLQASIVDQIIASGINKEQFNLLLANIKGSVDFE